LVREDRLVEVGVRKPVSVLEISPVERRGPAVAAPDASAACHPAESAEVRASAPGKALDSGVVVEVRRLS